MTAEENAIVLDYLAQGRSTSYKSEPLAQVLGVNYFTLLEIVPKTPLKIHERIYVGKEERDKVEFIKRRIPFKELTNTAQSELEKAVEALVLENEAKYVAFYNEARPITIKRHQLELLPGCGKKHMQHILAEREKKPFASFQDLETRVPLMPAPVKIIVRRIEEELQGDVKHYIFVRPPATPRERDRRF